MEAVYCILGGGLYIAYSVEACILRIRWRLKIAYSVIPGSQVPGPKKNQKIPNIPKIVKIPRILENTRKY